jgi:DNA-binding NtrC family response regulator
MLRELRRQKARMPAVIITAYGIPEQLVEAAELGAIDCVRKPFSIQTIRNIVRDVIETATLDEDFVPESASDYLLKGRHAMINGDLVEAERLLTTAATLASDRAEVSILLGIIAYLQKRHAEAALCFERALAVDPSSKTASEYLSWLASISH